MKPYEQKFIGVVTIMCPAYLKISDDLANTTSCSSDFFLKLFLVIFLSVGSMQLQCCWQGASSPPPFAAPIARKLSVSASVAGEHGLMSCVLPDELLVDILQERLQV